MFKEPFKRSTNKRHVQVVLTVFFSLSVPLCGADIYIFHSFDIKKHERKNWTLPPSQALHFKDKLTWAKGQLSNNTLYCPSVIGLIFTAFEGKGQTSCFWHLFIIFYRIGYEGKSTVCQWICLINLFQSWWYQTNSHQIWELTINYGNHQFIMKKTDMETQTVHITHDAEIKYKRSALVLLTSSCDFTYEWLCTIG